jgi:hypothetical protein
VLLPAFKFELDIFTVPTPVIFTVGAFALIPPVIVEVEILTVPVDELKIV